MVPKYCPSTPLPPVSLKLAGLCTVNEQEDDSVIFQTNPFTNQSVVARKCDNWCELYRNVQVHVQIKVIMVTW